MNRSLFRGVWVNGQPKSGERGCQVSLSRTLLLLNIRVPCRCRQLLKLIRHSGMGAACELADEFFEVLLAGPGIDNASAQPESAVQYCAGEERLAVKLEFLQDGFVQTIDRLRVLAKYRRRVAETHDAETLGLENLDIPVVAQQTRQQPGQPNIALNRR